MQYYQKRIRAGQCLEIEIYEALSDGRKAARSKNHTPTPEGQKKRNERRARLQLARTINANFEPGDLYTTLTFDDAHLPVNRKQVEREADNFIRRVKYHMGDGAGKLRYVCKLAKGNKNGRWHIHIVLNLRDANAVRKLWQRGGAKVSWLDAQRDYTGLANYLFNQLDEEHSGKRWKQNNHMKRPIVVKKRWKPQKNRQFLAIPRGHILMEERRPDCICESWYFRYLRIAGPPARQRAGNGVQHRVASSA